MIRVHTSRLVIQLFLPSYSQDCYVHLASVCSESFLVEQGLCHVIDRFDRAWCGFPSCVSLVFICRLPRSMTSFNIIRANIVPITLLVTMISQTLSTQTYSIVCNNRSFLAGCMPLSPLTATSDRLYVNVYIYVNFLPIPLHIDLVFTATDSIASNTLVCRQNIQSCACRILPVHYFI